MKTAEQFWAMVDKTKECWEWQGARTGANYGNLSWLGVTKPAHRVSYELSVGPIPDGLLVRHDCDNPPCVRPEHLRTGTHLENRQDSVSRNRANRGERHGQHKLTDLTATEILALWATGEHALETLAAKYNVSRRVIHALVTRETWVHLAGERIQHKGSRLTKGEANVGSKLTAEQVASIRRRFSEGELRANMAKEYSVSWTSIDYIVKGKSWRP